MRFAVCIHQVPDVAAPAQVRDGQLVLDAGRVVLDAYAASAVEAALQLKEAHGGEVEVVLVGPQKAAETLRKALAMGADRGTHLLISEDAALDSRAVVALLADHLGGSEADAILTGKQSQDTDAGLVGGMLAEALGRPYVTNAVGLEQDGDALVVTRQGDRGQEVIALPAPCLVTCSNDMNDPRIPNLKGIMASKKKPVETVEASPEAPAVRTVAYAMPPEREPGQRVEGDEPAAVAQTLVRLLSDEARAI